MLADLERGRGEAIADVAELAQPPDRGAEVSPARTAADLPDAAAEHRPARHRAHYGQILSLAGSVELVVEEPPSGDPEGHLVAGGRVVFQRRAPGQEGRIVG